MQAAKHKDSSQFRKVFLEARDDLDQILRRYEIPAAEAGALLEETVVEWIYKGDHAEDPSSLLRSKLRKKCRRYWVDRRRSFVEAVERKL